MASKKGKAEEEAAVDLSKLPDDERCFTHRDRGAHGVYLRKAEFDTSFKPPRVVVRHILARIQRGVMFDPFAECGAKGKNKTFREIEPEKAFEVLSELALNPESPVVFWGKRPMSEDEKEHDRQLKAVRKERDEQSAANAQLKALLLENGLKIPEGL